MRVVMLLGRSTGGIGTHVAQLSADLRGLGVDVIVVTHPLTAATFDLGPVRLLWPGSAGWVRGAGDLSRLRRLVSTADIVHAHGHQGALLATLATWGARRGNGAPKVGQAKVGEAKVGAAKLGAPKIVVSQHNAVLAGSGRQALKRLSQRWVAARADLVTGASSDLVEQALAFGARRVEPADVPSPRVPALLAQPPADPAERARLRRLLLESLEVRKTDDSGHTDGGYADDGRADDGRADDRDHADPDLPLVVTISRIAPQKNLPVLVQAASRLGRRCTWVVLGGGDPELLGRLRGQARALSAPVSFVGARGDVDQWLRAAEVFVLPSQWEARALVVQEAMAAGTPVVATDVGGLHDLVSGTGLLVIPGDSEAVVQAITAATDSLLADPALRAELVARGRQVAAALPDGPATAARWLARYAEILQMT